MREIREKLRFEAEIKAAREVQQQLLPQSPPEIDELDIASICLPQREVGGDYFDYVWLDEERKRFGIVIADVQGKGLKAAMTASVVSGMLTAVLSEDDCSTGEILCCLNELLYRRMARRTSVCLALAVLDLTNWRVKLSIAGLPEPILKQGSHINSLSPDGNRFPLGATSRGEYQELIKELPEGSTLVFYTDGIPEAINSNGEVYGFERFEEAIRQQKPTLDAQSFLDALLSDVKQFAGKTPQEDDLTLIVVKHSGAPIKKIIRFHSSKL
jgi:sigma-B regulation protein RsbU (phosphoserine phosphatase)